MSALVVINQLRHVGQRAEVRFVQGVVVPGAAVDKDNGRLFSHPRTIDDELGSLHIEEEPATIDAHVHFRPPACLAWLRSFKA